MTMRAAIILAIVCGVGLGSVGVASAQPWAEGVTEDKKSVAKAKLEEGNALYLKAEYEQAMASYNAALEAWNHPAIRFNLVRCQVQLKDMVKAGENLELALKYGKDPFTEEVYQEVLTFQKMLENMVGEIEVSCKQEGATLTFDGQPFIDKCPGSQKRRVVPGRHAVVATKDGFLTKEMPVIVIGGKKESVSVELIPLDKAAKVVHRWPTWIPWVVFGSGLAVTGLGVLIEIDAQSQMNRYDQQVASDCAVSGCVLTDGSAVSNALNDQRERAESRDKLAIGVMSVGIVGAAVGGVLLFMNRGKTVYEDPVKAGAQVGVTPTADGAAVTVSGHF